MGLFCYLIRARNDWVKLQYVAKNIVKTSERVRFSNHEPGWIFRPGSTMNHAHFPRKTNFAWNLFNYLIRARWTSTNSSEHPGNAAH
jgi:hypothetical protein